MRFLSALSVAIVVGLASFPLGASLAPDQPAGVPGLFEREALGTPGERIRAEIEAAAAHLGLVPAPLADVACPTFEAAVYSHFVHLGVSPPATVPALEDAELEAAIACLLDAQRRADVARDALLAASGLDEDDLLPFVTAYDPALYDEVPSVDVSVALGAAHLLAGRVDALLDVIAMRGPPAPSLSADQPQAPPEIDLEPVLAVDRLGPTHYNLDYALIVDTAGNDLYDNNAGGGMIAIGGGPTIPPTGNESTWQHVVAPAGEDAPHVVVGGQFEDSELVISAALAIDTDGDDTYGVYREAGRDGICTSELIVRRVATQGGAVAGPAMLIDTAGNNELRARVIAQGQGHLGGVGVLYLGPGDDSLRGVRTVQGSGVFGGVGILFNEAGDDQYWAHVPEGGTFNADLGFCDQTARYAQGSGFGRVTGVAAGVYGILRDEAGNDIYDTDLKGQGFGMVFGTGMLVDLAGNDLYVAQEKAMGYAEGHQSTGGPGIGVLYDEAGDDTYAIGAAPGIGMGGGADPGAVPDPYTPVQFWVNEVIGTLVDPLLLTGAGVLWDRAGNDSYGLPGRANGMMDTRGGTVGVFVDDQ